MKNKLLSLLFAFSCVNAACAAETKSFLQSGDHLVFIGDSLTAIGQYVHMVDGVVQQAYPDAGIKVVNHGSGGARAGAAVPLLEGYLVTNTPTLVFMMFGVNDTQWRNEDIEKKSAAFTDNLKKMHDFCVSKNLPLILIKESPFSHNQANDLWLSGANTALDAILAAQQAYADLHQIPVIDGYGRYKRNFAAAGSKDPRYEFTPDVVHPISPGSAALSASLINALGVGLELSSGPRPELSPAASTDLQIDILDDLSVVAPGQTIRVRVLVQNASRLPKTGSATLFTSFGKPVRVDCSLAPLRSKIIEIPVVLPEANLVSPLFVRLTTGVGACASDTILFAAPQQSLAKTPAAFSEKDFPLFIHQKGYRGKTEYENIPPPVTALSVTANQQAIHLAFHWDDATPVLADDTTISRTGQPVEAPVEVLTRSGSQKCDSIDFLLDMRTRNETGRPTADTDGVPDGVVKIVVYRKAINGGGELGFRCHPANMKERITLTGKGKQIELGFAPPAPVEEFSLTAFVTDCCKEEKGNAACFTLQDGWPGDPMRSLRFTTEPQNNVFYRIGY